MFSDPEFLEQQRELEEQARREQDARAQTEQEQREREARRCPSSFNYDPPISGVGLNQKTMFLVADKQTGNNVGQVTVVLTRGDASSRVRANVAFLNITSNCMYYVNGYFTSDAAGRNTIQAIDLGTGPKFNPGKSTNGYRDMSVPSTRHIFLTPDFTLAGSVN